MQTLIQLGSSGRVRNIALFQPPYPYGKSQVYLPGGLVNLGSRLMAAGLTVGFTDLNLERLDDATVQSRLAAAEVIGFTVLGPPYIPVILDHIKRIRQAGFQQPILIGGQGVERMKAVDFQAWFGGDSNTRQVSSDAKLAAILGVAPNHLKSAYETSAAPMLRRMDSTVLRQYLTSEFCLFTSQGCSQECDFCGADKGRPEEYRSFESLADELDFICQSLQSYRHSELRIYLSNLDLFQTPTKLEEAMELIAKTARKYGITPNVRGLATAHFTQWACKKDPELPKRLKEYGLTIVAFGADGSTEATWKRQNKRHNSLSKLEDAINALQEAGVIVELLMVIGFPDDSYRDMLNNLTYSIRQARRKAVIRPYLAKASTPSGRWASEDRTIEEFRKDSDKLTLLDYAMLGSPQTHPNRGKRWMANIIYLTIIGLLWPFGLCPTSPLVAPPTKGLGRSFAKIINRLMPFDR